MNLWHKRVFMFLFSEFKEEHHVHSPEVLSPKRKKMRPLEKHRHVLDRVYPLHPLQKEEGF